MRKMQCCGAGAGGSEIILVINIYCSQFGGCQDEETLISTSIDMVLSLKNSLKWQYMTGAGAEIMDKGGAGAVVGAENK